MISSRPSNASLNYYYPEGVTLDQNLGGTRLDTVGACLNRVEPLFIQELSSQRCALIYA